MVIVIILSGLLRKRTVIFLLALFLFPRSVFSWGFFAHKEINRLAVFTLPPGLIAFYKKNIDWISQHAVDPDRRRHLIKEEPSRHFIDLDAYTDSLPKYWKQAVEKFGEDSLKKHGIVPWHIYFLKQQLTEAFRQKNEEKILRLSADIGHYIGDAHVPLHTTRNYNGQLTGQHGIHAFWESRLPELFFDSYSFFTGPAEYIDDVQGYIWQAVYESNAAVDSVLSFEKELSLIFPPDKKFSYEERGGNTVRVYCRAYSEAYHAMLGGMVEKRMRASVKMLGDIWYTCWVDAGQPVLGRGAAVFFDKQEVHEFSGECTH